MYSRLFFILSCSQIMVITILTIALVYTFPLFVSFVFMPLIASLYLLVIRQIQDNIS